MTYRCTVERNTSTAVDPHNNPTKVLTEVLTDLPCYIWSSEERRNPMTLWNSNREGTYERTKGIVPKGTDIREDDIMTVNTDRQGIDQLIGRYIIRGINPRKNDHLELYLERYDAR